MFKLKSRHGGLPRRHGPRFSPGNRAGSGIGQQRLCRVAIRRDLGRQRVHAVELRFGADEGVKGDVDVLAIKVAGKVEEMRRSEEHTTELQSLMRISYAVLCLTK